MTGNCLIAQSGGPTAVINSSACGAIQEAQKRSEITGIYGAHNGILGVLNDRIFDLGKEDPKVIEGLRYTPSSALGTCRFKLTRDQEYEQVLTVFRQHDIRYFVYIGGNDSQDTACKISQIANEAGYALQVVGIPKTVDNDLCGTDHCPGYGSVIKLTAAMVREVGLDTEASYSTDKVNVIETMGRNAGWIAAGAVLAREARGQAPDVILLPEVPFDRENVMKRINELLTAQDRCVVVVSEGVKYNDGTYLAEAKGSLSTDSFGHRQLGGAAVRLKEMIEDDLSAKTRYCRPSIINRNGSHFASATDAGEAYELGRSAIQTAAAGHGGVMMTLVRNAEAPYDSQIGSVPLSEVANEERLFPEEWITDDGMDVKADMFRPYALPLIQGEVEVPIKDGLPHPVRLARHFI